MPVRRYKSLDEASRDLWVAPSDPTLLRRMQAVLSLVRLAPSAPPIRGVRKFHTIEEANVDRDDWVQRRVDEARRLATPPASH